LGTSPGLQPDSPRHVGLCTLVGQVEEALAPGVLDREADDRLEARVMAIVAERLGDLLETHSLPTEAVREQLFDDAREELLRLGPLGALLVNPAVEVVRVTGQGFVSYEQAGVCHALDWGFTSEASLKRALGRLCRRAGQPLQGDERVVQRRLGGGLELTAMMAGVSGMGTSVCIVRRRTSGISLDQWTVGGRMPRVAASVLTALVTSRRRLMVVAERQQEAQELAIALAAQASLDDAVLVLGNPDAAIALGPRVVSASWAAVEPSVSADVLWKMAPIVLAHLSSSANASRVLLRSAEGGEGLIASYAAPSALRAVNSLSAALTAGAGNLPWSAAGALIASAFDAVVEIVGAGTQGVRLVRIAEPVLDAAGSLALRDVVRSESDGHVTVERHAPLLAELMLRGVSLDLSG